MANNSWKNLEVWERVRWARARHYPSAAAAAAATGIKDGTYRCYERGPGAAKFIPLEYKHAREFARVFKVRWEWLLDGLGEPWLTDRDAEEDEEEDEDEDGRRETHHVQAWREYRGLTVAQLSKKSGISVQTITGIESGEIDPPTKLLDKLAGALDTAPGYLLDNLPEDADPNIFNTVKAIPKERRSQALEILKTFRPYTKLP
jgi:transcriptional regulator with XRE-family HTH domain